MTMQRVLREICIGLCLIGLWPVSAQAARETNIPDRYPSVGTSIRALGMGNALLTMRGQRASDMFYNPAALHDLPRNWEFAALGNDVGFNTRLISTVREIFKLSKDLNAENADAGKIRVFRDFFNNHDGEYNSIDYSLNLFSMGRRDWGFAVLANSHTTVSFLNRAFPNFQLRSRNDGVVGIGRSFGFLYDDLVVGVLAKGLYRLEIDKIVTTGSILGSSIKELIGFKEWGRSVGVAGDIGVRYELPIMMLNPAVAVTYQDIGGKQFFKSSVDDTRQSVNAAVGIHPTFGSGWEASVEGGMSELNQRRDLLTRLHAGAELKFPRFAATRLSVRAGTNQGYLATGLSIEWPIATLDLAYYGEEKGRVKRVGATYKFAGAFALNF